MMRRSRGFGLIELAIYGVIALVVAGILYKAETAFVAWIDHFGAEKQKALDAPILAEAQAAKTRAETDLAGALTDLEASRKGAAACSAGVEEGGKLKADAEAEKTRRLATTEKQLAGYRKSNAELERALAAAASGPKTCEQRLSAIDAALTSLAEQRIRFMLGISPTPPPAAEPGVLKVK